jgi:hypothetical protein
MEDIMTRGGAREGAGGKSTWNNGKTKTIRVPEALADQVLEYAKRLDKGAIEPLPERAIEPVTVSKVINLSGISIQIYNGKLVVYLEDLAKAGFDILPASLGVMFKAILRQS